MYDVNAKETRKHVILYSRILLGFDHGLNGLSQRSGIMISGAGLQVFFIYKLFDLQDSLQTD